MPTWVADMTYGQLCESFTICVLGEDPFGRFLDVNLRGKMIGDAADRADSKFSAKLLALAKIVHDAGH
jgi:hypothetical protein